MIEKEVKVEINNDDILSDLIQKAYFEKGQMGKLMGDDYCIESSQIKDSKIDYLKDLDGSIIKATNENIINGSIRLIVNSSKTGFQLKPVSIYCIEENDKYTLF